MRLAEAGAAVDEQRVVSLRRRFRDRERGRVRDAVRRADHEQREDVLRVQPGKRLPRLRPVVRNDRRPRKRLVDAESNTELCSAGVAHRGTHEAAEVRLDPLAREVVRNGHDELPVGDRYGAGLTEPGAVGGVVECALESTGHLGPERICSHALTRLQTFRPRLLSPWKSAGEHTNVSRTRQWVEKRLGRGWFWSVLQGFSLRPQSSPQVWIPPDSRRWQHRAVAFRAEFPSASDKRRAVDNPAVESTRL